MNKLTHMMRAMNDTSSTCISKRCEILKQIQTTNPILLVIWKIPIDFFTEESDFSITISLNLIFISDDQLILTCVDFSFPALSAVPATIAFLFQQILLCPEIQKKIHAEIDHVVGHGRAPTLNDRIEYVFCLLLQSFGLMKKINWRIILFLILACHTPKRAFVK